MAVTIRPMEIAPGSGVPTLRSARGRARPILGTSEAVSAAAATQTFAAVCHAWTSGAPPSTSSISESTKGNNASSIVLSPSDALEKVIRSVAEVFTA